MPFRRTRPGDRPEPTIDDSVDAQSPLRPDAPMPPPADEEWNDGPVQWTSPPPPAERRMATKKSVTDVSKSGVSTAPSDPDVSSSATAPIEEEVTVEIELDDLDADADAPSGGRSETSTPLDSAAGRPSPKPSGGVPSDPVGPPAPPTPTRSPRRRGRFFRAVRILLLATTFLGVLGIATGVGVVWWFSRDLPRFDTLKDYSPRQTTRVLAADGTEMGDIFRDLRRTVVPVDELPPIMVQALVSAEDANFFEHRGVDYLGIVKAVVMDVLRGSRLRGASTLTQQTVKTFLLSGERKVSRKIREAILAHRLEQNLTKDEILYLYLNQIEFGDGRAGIEEAARHYFGKSARDLELAEAAVLAAIPQSPTRLNPRRNPERARQRRNYVLRRMAENGYVPPEVARREMERPIELAPLPSSPTPKPGGYYLEEVRRILTAELGAELVETGGLIVETAMHPALQEQAEAAARQGLREIDKRQGYRGALGQFGEDAWKALSPHLVPPAGDDPAIVRNRYRNRTLPDLRLVDVASILKAEGDAEKLRSIAGAVRWHPLEVGREVVARVASVTRNGATLSLGPDVGHMAFDDTRWARKWNPRRGTAAPKSLTDVLKPGDLVLARVVAIDGCSEVGSQSADATDVGENGANDEGTAGCEKKVRVALEQDPQVEGALVAIRPETREIVAMVGGFDHRRSPYNRATQAKRQPGSAFKPFVYAAAISTGRMTPRSIVYDTPEIIRDRWTGKPWEPRNYSRDVFDGPMTLRESLARSKNTVAVKLLADMAREPGVDDDTAQDRGLALVRDLAWRAGIDSPIPRSLTVALGSGEVTPVEMVNAMTTLASEGLWSEPVLIKRVRTPDGTVLLENRAEFEQPPPAVEEDDDFDVDRYLAGFDDPPAPDAGRSAPEQPPEHPDGRPWRGLRPGVAYVTLDMMRSVVESPNGTARSMQAIGRPVAAKTGTASEHRDAWFVGFTPELVAGVWVGFDDHSPMGPRETGGGAAGPLWRHFMLEVEDRLPRREWPVPDDVAVVDIDPRNDLLADERSPYLEREVFLRGTEPVEYAPADGVATPEDLLRGFLRGDGP